MEPIGLKCVCEGTLRSSLGWEVSGMEYGPTTGIGIDMKAGMSTSIETLNRD